MKIRERMEKIIEAQQNAICSALEELDGSTFRTDQWEREGGGGGTTRVLQDSPVFEKAGVNVSIVYGKLTPEAARSMGGGAELGDQHLEFYACGLSLVIHPHNPMAPTAHANFRYFERGKDEPVAWWFGGGADLTPSYLFEEDCQHFHRTLKECCDRHDEEFYPRYKKWCDEYFLIKHRGERRGVGGIFFDDLNDRDPEELLKFAEDGLASFVPAYVPLVARRKDAEFSESQKEWQQLRRGRYAEFNLVYDRGTVFGLRTAGRIESILMSLPLTARWEYCHEPEVGSEEARVLEVLQEPRDWV